MDKVLWVMLGGALGSASRYLIYEWMSKISSLSSIWGTMTVNILGSLLIGITFYFLDKGNLSNSTRLFIMVGLLGGFTTFSTYALDSINLIRSGEMALAIFYILLSNIASILAVIGAYTLMKYFLN